MPEGLAYAIDKKLYVFGGSHVALEQLALRARFRSRGPPVPPLLSLHPLSECEHQLGLTDALAISRRGTLASAGPALEACELDLHAQSISGENLPPEPDALYPGEEGERAAKLLQGHYPNCPYLRHRLYYEYPWHDRIIREVSLEEGFVLRDVLYPHGAHSRLYLRNPIHQQERVPVRDELPDRGGPERRVHASTSFATRPRISRSLKSLSMLTSVPPPASTTSSTPKAAIRSTTATHRTGESI